MKLKIEELLRRIENLEQENEILGKEIKKLKEKKNKRRNNIKTTPKEIVDYWSRIQDECGLSVDWAEADKRCWRCGYEARLQRCHIIPDSLGGKDEPANLVLLCERCHIDAPNVESKTFMWDWIRANGTSFYDTFWNIRAEKEYEFIYGKTFREELKERDIISPRDLDIFWNIPIGRSVNHFAHPWKNDSTNAGLIRMSLEVYDKKYHNRKPKSQEFRDKEKKFENMVYEICKIAKMYNWNVWEGRTKNPFSITLNTLIDRERKKYISIKLCKGDVYKACFINEANPNNNKTSEYTIQLGKENKEVKEFVEREVKEFADKYGKNKKQEYVFTINPIWNIRN